MRIKRTYIGLITAATMMLPLAGQAGEQFDTQTNAQQPESIAQQTAAKIAPAIPSGMDVYLIGDGNHENIDVLKAANELLPTYLEIGAKKIYLECTQDAQEKFDSIQNGSLKKQPYLDELAPYKTDPTYKHAYDQREVLYDFLSTANQGGAHVLCADPSTKNKSRSQVSIEAEQRAVDIGTFLNNIGLPQSLANEAEKIGGGSAAFEKVMRPWIQEVHPEAIAQFDDLNQKLEAANIAWMERRLDDRAVMSFIEKTRGNDPIVVIRGDNHFGNVENSLGNLLDKKGTAFHYVQLYDQANTNPIVDHDFNKINPAPRTPDIKADISSGNVTMPSPDKNNSIDPRKEKPRTYQVSAP